VTAKTRVPPHPFVADPDIPPDHNGRRTCRCGLPGEPGDAHHTLPEVVGQDARQRAAGEGSER